jgi:hypothetical protein
MCHQRGSVIAEVVLKRVTRPDGDSDPRTPDLLAQELVEKLNDRSGSLCRKDLGSLAVKSAVIDGPIAEPLCDLFSRVMRAREADWRRKHKDASTTKISHCKRVIERLLHSKLATAFFSYYSRIVQVKEQRQMCERALQRMLHTQLAAAFDGFSDAVDRLRTQRKLVQRALSRWNAPMMVIGFDLWCDFVLAAQSEKREEAHLQEKKMLSNALEECSSHHKSLVEKECQRRIDICSKTVKRMLHIHTATAFDYFRDRVQLVKSRKTAAKRVLKRILRTHLAGAFDWFSDCVTQLAEHRRIVQKTVSRWRQPMLREFFNGWCAGVDVLMHETMEEARHSDKKGFQMNMGICCRFDLWRFLQASQLAQQRLSSELADTVRDHCKQILDIKQRRTAGMRERLISYT